LEAGYFRQPKRRVTMDENQEIEFKDNPPPGFKSWKTIYLIVLGNLALLIVLFYIFTKVFNE